MEDFWDAIANLPNGSAEFHKHEVEKCLGCKIFRLEIFEAKLKIIFL